MRAVIHIRKFSLFGSFVVAAACSNGRAADSPDPLRTAIQRAAKRLDTTSIDRSTPDRAVKSYWRLEDGQRAAFIALDSVEIGEAHPFRASSDSAYARLLGGDALDQRKLPDYNTFEQFEREIVEVKNESESRAVVLARIRNTTPIPPSTVVSDADAKSRRDGSEVRYVLERDAGGWRIVQAQTRWYDGSWHDWFTPRSGTVSTYVSP